MIARLMMPAMLILLAPAGHAAKHAYPEFSPDGQWLVFSSDQAGTHDIYLVRSDGSGLRRITEHDSSETQPTWSPDGKRIAYVRRPWNPSNRSVLFIVDRDGKNATRVPEVSGLHLPNWAEDGRIYFSMRVAGRDDIVSLLPDGSDLVNHTDTPEIDETNVAVSGSTLVYDRADGDDYVIEFLDLDSGAKRVLRRGSIDWDPAWISRGTSLLIGVYPSRDATRSILTEVSRNGEVIKTWTPASRNVFWPTVSPDGKTVVFSYSKEDFGIGELHELTLATGTIQRLLGDE